MIAVVQRVTGSSVTVDGVVMGAIGPGINVLLGVAAGDRESAVAARDAMGRVVLPGGGATGDSLHHLCLGGARSRKQRGFVDHAARTAGSAAMDLPGLAESPGLSASPLVDDFGRQSDCRRISVALRTRPPWESGGPNPHPQCLLGNGQSVRIDISRTHASGYIQGQDNRGTA